MIYDRLDRMIASRGLSEETRQRILDRLHEANVAPDDPIAVIFVIEASIADQAELLASLPEAVARRLRVELNDRQGPLINDLRDTVRDTLRTAVAQATHAMLRRAGLQLAALGLIAATALVGLGIAWGAQMGLERRAGFMEALAARPDAETWARLIVANDRIDATLAVWCAPDSPLFLPQQNGQAACGVPLWIGDAPTPTPEAFPARVMVELRHRIATAPGWVFLLLGILGTLGIHPLIRRVHDRPGA